MENDIIYAFNSTFYTLCLFVSIYFALSLRISHWSRAWHEKNTHIYTILYFTLFVIVCSLSLSLTSSCIYLFYLFILFYSIYILYFLPSITRSYILSYFLVSFSHIRCVSSLCSFFFYFRRLRSNTFPTSYPRSQISRAPHCS